MTSLKSVLFLCLCLSISANGWLFWSKKGKKKDAEKLKHRELDRSASLSTDSLVALDTVEYEKNIANLRKSSNEDSRSHYDNHGFSFEEIDEDSPGPIIIRNSPSKSGSENANTGTPSVRSKNVPNGKPLHAKPKPPLAKNSPLYDDNYGFTSGEISKNVPNGKPLHAKPKPPLAKNKNVPNGKSLHAKPKSPLAKNSPAYYDNYGFTSGELSKNVPNGKPLHAKRLHAKPMSSIPENSPLYYDNYGFTSGELSKNVPNGKPSHAKPSPPLPKRNSLPNKGSISVNKDPSFIRSKSTPVGKSLHARPMPPLPKQPPTVGEIYATPFTPDSKRKNSTKTVSEYAKPWSPSAERRKPIYAPSWVPFALRNNVNNGEPLAAKRWTSFSQKAKMPIPHAPWPRRPRPDLSTLPDEDGPSINNINWNDFGKTLPKKEPLYAEPMLHPPKGTLPKIEPEYAEPFAHLSKQENLPGKEREYAEPFAHLSKKED